MEKDEYDVSGHVIIPYNNKTKELFFNNQRNVDYSLHKNGVMLENTTTLPKKFCYKYLIPKGFELKSRERIVLVPKKRVNGILIGITKIKKNDNIVELLISVHAPDMRRVIKGCDSLVGFIESQTGDTIEKRAKLWTRQEVC